MVNEELKLKMIFMCDKLKKKCPGTIYSNELRALRTKYIYKDINFSEFKRDVEWINNLKKIFNDKTSLQS